VKIAQFQGGQTIRPAEFVNFGANTKANFLKGNEGWSFCESIKVA